MDLAPLDTTKAVRTLSTSRAPSTETGKVSSSSPRCGECFLSAASCVKMMPGEILFTPSLFFFLRLPPSHSVPLYSRKNVINAFRYHRFTYFTTSFTSYHHSSPLPQRRRSSSSQMTKIHNSVMSVQLFCSHHQCDQCVSPVSVATLCPLRAHGGGIAGH